MKAFILRTSIVCVHLFIISCSTVYEDDICRREYHENKKIFGLHEPHPQFYLYGWNCENVNIYITDSAHIKIIWCNLTKDTLIFAPVMWLPEVKLSKGKHDRFFYLQGDTLIIDYLKTYAIDYGLRKDMGIKYKDPEDQDSNAVGGSAKLLKKDSCLINIINTSELFPEGLRGVKYFHLRDYIGDIYKKNPAIKVSN